MISLYLCPVMDNILMFLFKVALLLLLLLVIFGLVAFLYLTFRDLVFV